MNNYIDSWVERAHSYPLSLVISYRRQHGFLNPVYSVRVQTLITEHQFILITLDSDDTSISSILEDLERSNFEMLESFSLATRFYSKSSPPDALRYASKLRTLSLCAIYPITFNALPIPWRQLTSLTIAFWEYIKCNPDVSVDILRACVNLEEFIINGNCDGMETNASDLITLNHLRKLHTYCRYSMFLLLPQNTFYSGLCCQGKWI